MYTSLTLTNVNIKSIIINIIITIPLIDFSLKKFQDTTLMKKIIFNEIQGHYKIIKKKVI